MFDQLPHWSEYLYVGSGTTPVQICIYWIRYVADMDMHMLNRVPHWYRYVYVTLGITLVLIFNVDWVPHHYGYYILDWVAY